MCWTANGIPIIVTASAIARPTWLRKIHKPANRNHRAVAQGSKEADVRVALDVFSERQQSDARDLEALHSERDADDSDAKNHPRQNVLEPDDEAPAENDPQKVEKDSHRSACSIISCEIIAMTIEGATAC